MAELFITGATGFVGSHLVEAVARQGLRARSLVRPTSDRRMLERHGVEAVEGALEDEGSLRRALGDAPVVLHLAAATRALNPEGFHEVNARGTERLLDAMVADGASRRLVYLSSLAAVGPTRGRPVRPEDEPRPLTAYGRSKLAGERAALERDGVEPVVLRPPAVYGPRDRDLLPFFRMAERGVLVTAGSSERPMQLIHARDLAEAVLVAASSEVRGIFHVAEPAQYRWSQVLSEVGAAVGTAPRVVRVPGAVVRMAAAVSEVWARTTRRPVIFDRDKARELLAPGWTCDTASARERLGFEASVPLAEGLRETAAWYRAEGWL